MKNITPSLPSPLEGISANLIPPLKKGGRRDFSGGRAMLNYNANLKDKARQLGKKFDG